MDGLQATRHIRALDGPNSRVPILALTANVMTQERERYLAAGMNECLTKPIDWDQLFGAIARYAPQPDGAAAAGRAAPATSTLHTTEPLVDETVLASLEAMSGREVVREWMQAGMRTYERSAQAMEQDGVALATFAAEGHKLLGSASTLGLARIGALGMRIEEAAKAGSVSPDLVMQLRESMEATRRELARRSLMLGPPAP